VPAGKLEEKNMTKKIFFFASLKKLKSLKKGVGSGVRSGYGSISQRYGSADLPQHCFTLYSTVHLYLKLQNLHDKCSKNKKLGAELRGF
jgi:hypothetical protein